MAEVRDGNEPLLLGFGAVWVLPNIRCLVQFEFFASAEILVLFRFSSCILCFEFNLVLSGFGRLTVLIFPQWLPKHTTQNCYFIFL